MAKITEKFIIIKIKSEEDILFNNLLDLALRFMAKIIEKFKNLKKRKIF
jgi:hypothetical protein